MKTACLFAFAATITASAQAPAVEASSPCPNAQTQFEMNMCASQEFAKARAVLDKTYAGLSAKLGATERGKLHAAQRNWIAFRESHCEWEASFYDGGSMQPMVRGFCLAAVTSARTKQLAETLKSIAAR